MTLRQTRRGRRFWLRLAFVLAILATAVFALRAAWFAWELSERAERPVAGWMTPRYIVAVYDVDPQALAAILNIPTDDDPGLSVARLAAASGRSTETVLDDIDALIDLDRNPE
ncbi:MAG: hypothetical protein CFE34_07660 [Rhodobacteraceae bacterium PARR1]|nr:MAG: hypothetical protein CFE34_07660 [Rhodobacteraceae bacterium PARR1]